MILRSPDADVGQMCNFIALLDVRRHARAARPEHLP